MDSVIDVIVNWPRASPYSFHTTSITASISALILKGTKTFG